MRLVVGGEGLGGRERIEEREGLGEGERVESGREGEEGTRAGGGGGIRGPYISRDDQLP